LSHGKGYARDEKLLTRGAGSIAQTPFARRVRAVSELASGVYEFVPKQRLPSSRNLYVPPAIECDRYDGNLVFTERGCEIPASQRSDCSTGKYIGSIMGLHFVASPAYVCGGNVR